jgi:hypothetical protein
MQRDVPAMPRQIERDGAAKPLRRAGDEKVLILSAMSAL